MKSTHFILHLVLSIAILFAHQVYAENLSGTIVSRGSDTLEKMMKAWSTEFSKQHPGVTFDLVAAGSSTAPPALISGESHLGPMSRKMKSKEVAAFEQKHGYKPTAVRVALDALAVFVHKDNPATSLTMPQVDAIFSASRKCGAAASIGTWGDAGVSGPLSSKTLELYGRNSKSGTYGFFKKKALCKGDYASSLKEMSSSEAIVEKISQSTSAVGYSGIGYQVPGVKALMIAKKEGKTAYPADKSSAASGKYPLSRYLYIYVNKAPGQDIDSKLAAFINFILSADGQRIVENQGYIAVTDKTINKDKQKLGI